MHMFIFVYVHVNRASFLKLCQLLTRFISFNVFKIKLSIFSCILFFDSFIMKWLNQQQ